jgi:hypothetical protein
MFGEETRKGFDEYTSLIGNVAVVIDLKSAETAQWPYLLAGSFRCSSLENSEKH